ncbi:TetR/AcrR family transcriptional regulator [Citrobacter sp. JGM124]|uniref:TetR/AcrR family transcriptional regulator n=1 Tax=Citrobacter sp. JGM124 TaxID=2799789 RepID=UPI001BA94F19|nr:TetR/AcrR family transcriptional regulator [Citrobacter sp. JGM124]MBS0849413.1 TetR/AcrR family transcriptional regulator [Citrobacter sp. JGM124]
MVTLKIESELANKLALSLSQKPRANLQQLATMVGISKATLYRIVPTREQLVATLQQQAEQHITDSLLMADLSVPPYLDALSRFIKHILLKKELYIFWTISLGMNSDYGHVSTAHHSATMFLVSPLEAFFLKGQQAGIFRIDMPAVWLAKTLDYLVYAAADSSLRGEIASLKSVELVEKMFIAGATTTEPH